MYDVRLPNSRALRGELCDAGAAENAELIEKAIYLLFVMLN